MPKAQNPFDVDDEEKPVVEEKTAPEVPEGAEIPVDKDEDEDDPTDDQPTRAEKRANRFREANDRAKAAEEKAAQESTARAAAEARAQQADQYVREMAARAVPQQPQADPLDQYQRAAQEEINLLMRESAVAQKEGKLDEALSQQLKDRYFAANQRLSEVAAARVQRWNQYQQQQNQPNTQFQAEYAALQMRLRAEFPDVVDNQDAWAYANAEWAKIIALKKGDRRDWTYVKEAMATTRRAFKLGSPPAPSETTKRRYAGVGSGGAAQQTNGKRTIPMTREFKLMAHAKYPSLEHAKAEQKWAQGIGKSLLDEEDS